MEIHLSALENVTCWAFRSLCTGATDSYTGVLSMSSLIRRNNAWKEVDTFTIEGQRQWIQVSTSQEKECSDFIKKLDEQLRKEPEKDNVYGIQINASSPSPELIRIGRGPALIKRATKVSNLLKELLKQDRYKVSIKVRLGLNREEVRQGKILDLFEQIEKIQDKNLANVTVHFKHAQQRSAEPYDYSILKKLTSYNIPLILNGGIKNVSDFKRITRNADKKNIVGLMAGRAAMENPNCFTHFSNELNGTSLANRNLAEIKNDFQELCKKHEPAPLYLKNIKHFCPWART